MSAHAASLVHLRRLLCLLRGSADILGVWARDEHVTINDLVAPAQVLALTALGYGD